MRTSISRLQQATSISNGYFCDVTLTAIRAAVDNTLTSVQMSGGEPDSVARLVAAWLKQWIINVNGRG